MYNVSDSDRGRQMVDNVSLGYKLVNQRRIENGITYEVKARIVQQVRYVRDLPGAQIVKNRDLVVLTDECIDQV